MSQDGVIGPDLTAAGYRVVTAHADTCGIGGIGVARRPTGYTRRDTERRGMPGSTMSHSESVTAREPSSALAGLEESDAMPGGEAVGRLDFLTVLRVSGDDALPWLQGQLTADISEVDTQTSRLAAWCSPRGRVLAVFRLLADASDGYRMVCERWFADSLLARLRMFIMRSNVRIDDADDAFGVAGIAGTAGTRALPGRIARWAEIAEVDDAAGFEDMTIARVPGTHRRFIVTGPVARVAAVASSRTDAEVRQASPRAWHLADIRAGVTRITARTSDTFLPQMLNLDHLRAVSFEKGCYVGQEIVARAQHLGRVKRRAYVGRTAASAAVGDSIVDDAQDGAPKVGEVVSVEASPGGGSAACAVLGTASAHSPALRVARSGGAPIRVRPPDYMMHPQPGDDGIGHSRE